MKLLLVTEGNQEKQFLEALESYLKLNSVAYVTVRNVSYESKNNFYEEINAFKPDIIVSVGTTGTFLRILLLLDEISIPIVGASSYSQTFMTPITNQNYDGMLQNILKDKFEISESCRVIGKTNGNRTPPALNEISIFPTQSATIMRYSLLVDDELIWRDSADGLIISTPMGSSGYALSAGGPMILGEPGVLSIVPVNSLNKTTVPIVVRNESIIKIENITSKSRIDMIIDGQMRLHAGDEITITKSDVAAKIISFSKSLEVGKRLKTRISASEVDLRELPPTAKFIYKLLLYEGEMTQKEIAEASSIPSRTIRNSLNILLEKGLITKKVNVRDTRQFVYHIVK